MRQPVATYGLLIAIGVVFILQQILLASDQVLHWQLWSIYGDWWLRPWSPVTSTFGHDPWDIRHILFNGLMLFFFGRTLEQLIGPKRLVWLFLISGAVASIVQVEVIRLTTDAAPGPSLGASGAIMMIFGALAIIMPKAQILVMGLIPIPFWIVAIGYAVLDILGAIGPANGIGNIAHLSGMAIGIFVGFQVRKRMAEQGVQLRFG